MCKCVELANPILLIPISSVHGNRIREGTGRCEGEGKTGRCHEEDGMIAGRRQDDYGEKGGGRCRGAGGTIRAEWGEKRHYEGVEMAQEVAEKCESRNKVSLSELRPAG